MWSQKKKKGTASDEPSGTLDKAAMNTQRKGRGVTETRDGGIFFIPPKEVH